LVLWKLIKNVLSSLTVNDTFKFFRNVLFLVINTPTEPSSYSEERSAIVVQVHCIEHVVGRVHLSQMKIMAMMMIRIKVSTKIQIKGYYSPYSQCFDFVRDRAWYEKAEMTCILDSPFPSPQSLTY